MDLSGSFCIRLKNSFNLVIFNQPDKTSNGVGSDAINLYILSGTFIYC